MIEGELSGEVVARAVLGIPSDALIAFPAVIEGELSGEVVASAALGEVPDHPALIAVPEIIDGGLLGEVVARAILGVDPSTIAAIDMARAQTFGLTAKKPVYALEIHHPAIANNVRGVGDTQGVTLEGQAYPRLGFRTRLPQDKEGEIRQAGLEIDNVGRRLVEWVEASEGGRGATIRVMEIVIDSARNAQIVWEMTLDVGTTRLVNEKLSVVLVDEGSSVAPAIKLRHDPVESPGLF